MGLRLVHDRQAAPPVVARLRLSGLAFGGRPVLGRIALDLHAGETVALTGPSGIGKTTILRVLAGLERAQSAEVHRPDHLSMVFQEPVLMPWRTLVQNLTLTVGVTKAEAEAALAEVGLGGRGGDYPRQLSLGQQRRMALARAFAGTPDLLLMDEPFVSLDPALADEMMTLFETLRGRRPVATLLVTHVVSEAERLADRILKLTGSPAELH